MLFSLTSGGDYGLLMMTVLGEADAHSYLSVAEITGSKKIPVAYAGQLMTGLKKAGLVESKEGVGGGYRLAKPAEKISLKEIIEALEGPIAPVRCLSEKDFCCPSEHTCSMKPVWEETTALLHKQLTSKTLADIIRTPVK